MCLLHWERRVLLLDPQGSPGLVPAWLLGRAWSSVCPVFPSVWCGCAEASSRAHHPLGSQGQTGGIGWGVRGMCLFWSLLSIPHRAENDWPWRVYCCPGRGSSPTLLPPPPPSPSISLYPSAFLTPALFSLTTPASQSPLPPPPVPLPLPSPISPPPPLPHFPSPSPLPHFPSPSPSPISPPLYFPSSCSLGDPWEAGMWAGEGALVETQESQWFHKAAGLFQPLPCRRYPGHVAAAAPLPYPPPTPGLPANHHPGLAHPG